MKYLSISLIAVTAILADLVADDRLSPKMANEWDNSAGWILLVCLGLWIWAGVKED